MIRTAADACPGTRIDSAENQKKIELMKSLIRMRIQEDACRSLYFDFPHKYSQKRCVEYRKLNLDGKWIEVLLNCGSEPIEIQGQGEILFARRCEGNSLDVRGTLIRRLPSTGVMKTVLFIPIIIGLPVAMGMLCSSPLQTGAT